MTRSAVLVLLASAGCYRGAPEATRVEVSYRTRQSMQADDDYQAVAVHALAVPLSTETQILLFDRPGATCRDRDRPVAMAFLPARGDRPQGAKFLAPSGFTWACGMPRLEGREALAARVEGGRLKGRVDFHQAVPGSGNDATLRGDIDAEVCPSSGEAPPASPAGRTRAEIRVHDPLDGDWSRTVSMAIAWSSSEETMVFLHGDGPLDCQNYRLEPKAGMVSLAGPPSAVRDGVLKAQRVNFVHPRTGWSSPIPAAGQSSFTTKTWPNGTWAAARSALSSSTMLCSVT